MGGLRTVLGIVIGIVIGLGVVFVAHGLSLRFLPPPPEVQVTNPESMGAYLRTAPIGAILGLPVSWTVSTFLGAFAGAKIAARAWPGWTAGGVLAALALLNLAFIPHPLWMLTAAIVFVPAAAWFGAKLGGANAR